MARVERVVGRMPMVIIRAGPFQGRWFGVPDTGPADERGCVSPLPRHDNRCWERPLVLSTGHVAALGKRAALSRLPRGGAAGQPRELA